MSDRTAEWSLVDGELRLVLHSSSPAAEADLTAMYGVLNEPGEFVLETGDRLVARFVHFGRLTRCPRNEPHQA